MLIPLEAVLVGEKSYYYKVFKLGNIDIWTGKFFVVGDCPVPCRMFITFLASTHGVSIALSPPAFHLVIIKNVSRCCQMFLGEQNLSPFLVEKNYATESQLIVIYTSTFFTLSPKGWREC